MPDRRRGASAPAAGPVLVGDLAVAVPVLAAGTTAAAVDELFQHDPTLPAVIVGPGDAPRLVDRRAWGRALRDRHGQVRASRSPGPTEPLGDEPLVIGHEVVVGAAAAQVLAVADDGRPHATTVVRLADGTLGVVSTTRMLEVLAEQLGRQASTDALTGLSNQIALRGGRAGRFVGATVLAIDLDRLQDVNDRYGYAAGDQVLVEFARRVGACVRPEDLVVRLGGEEFAVVVDGGLPLSSCRMLAERLVLEASSPFLVNGAADGVEHVVVVGASVGLARTDARAAGASDPLGSVLRQAREGLARARAERREPARRARRRRAADVRDAVGADPVAAAVPSDDELADLLRDAVTDGVIDVHYQPVVDLASGVVTGAEALARWTVPAIGPIPPDRFIPLAERTGLVVEIGRQVLVSSCRAAATWDGTASVAVNVSAVQLADADFADHVSEALTSTGLAPRRLCLEITETAAIDDLDQAVTRLSNLRALGVRIALDDFGTGYSSMTLLRRLPLDVVKVDRSFVANLGGDPSDAVAVRLIVDSAHALGLTVVAEGVETAQQGKQVVALGVDLAQGWRYGRPQPAGSDLVARLDLAVQDAAAAETAEGVLGGSGELITVVDGAQRITYVSSNAKALLGFTPAQLIGREATTLFHPDDEAPSENASVRVHRVLHADGSRRWFRSRSWWRPDSTGMTQAVVTSEEITRLVETERRLVDSEAEFRGAFESAPLAMAVSRDDGTIMRANAALAALLGADPARPDLLIGTTVAQHTHPDDRQADAVNLAEVREGVELSHQVRKRFVRADGTPVRVTVWAAAVTTTAGPSIVAYVTPDPADEEPDGRH